MRSNFFGLALTLTLGACNYSPVNDYRQDEDLIGTAVTQMARTTKATGESKDRVVFFDEATRKIHQFDVLTFKHIGSYAVPRPELRHYPFSDDSGAYIVDVASKNIGVIQTPSGTRTDLNGFQGAPVSVAYHGPSHTLVIGDDLASVFLVRLNPDGSIKDQLLLGGMLKPGVNFRAGDFGPNGKLILSLTDLSLAVVDLEASFAQKKWVFENFNLDGRSLYWMAPVPGTTSRMLARSSDNVLLFDFQTKNIISSVDTAGLRIERYGKSYDPHVIFTDGTTSTSGALERSLFSSKSSEIRRDRLRHQGSTIRATELNLQQDLWTFMTIEKPEELIFRKGGTTFESAWNFVGVGRRLVQRRLSDGLAAVEIPMEDDVIVDISTHHLMRLYPSELGWASRTEIQTGAVVETKMFNLRHF